MNTTKQPYETLCAEEIQYLSPTEDFPWVILLDADAFMREAWTLFGEAHGKSIGCFADPMELGKALPFLGPDTVFVLRYGAIKDQAQVDRTVGVARAIKEQGFERVFIYVEKTQQGAVEQEARLARLAGVVTVGKPVWDLLRELLPKEWGKRCKGTEAWDVLPEGMLWR